MVMRGSNSRPGIGGHSHAVDDEAAVPLLLFATPTRILVEARPSPILGASDQACPERVHTNVIDLLIVLGDAAQGAIEEAWLPEFALRAPALIDAAHRTLLNRLDGQRNRHGIDWGADAMPMIREKHPGREVERVQRPCPMEGACQEDEIRLGEFSAPWEQAYGDEKVSVRKKRATQFRHGDTIRHRERDCEGRDADRKTGGPRYACFKLKLISSSNWLIPRLTS